VLLDVSLVPKRLHPLLGFTNICSDDMGEIALLRQTP
jgi:hypothetical protein